MKTNTLPSIKRKQIINLQRHELFRLIKTLEGAVNYHAASLTPPNLERALASLSVVRKRHDQVRRSFYKNMSYKGPGFYPRFAKVFKPTEDDMRGVTYELVPGGAI